MLAEPTLLYGREIGSSYQQQEETLGKHFLSRRPAKATPAPEPRARSRARPAEDSDQLPLSIEDLD
jgi:hypothetical protein